MELVFVINHTIIFFALTIGTYTDLKTREVPDWLNYGLIGTGFIIAFLYSLIFSKWSFLLNSLIGFIIFLVFSLIMFYSGQWGGGDSKMLMALGALIGFDSLKFPFIISFLINILLIGAIYGLIWSIVLLIKNFRPFSKEVKNTLKNKSIITAKRVFLIFIIILLITIFLVKDYFLRLIILGSVITTILTFYLWIFIKAVEKTSMLKFVTPDRLTEGDWIAKPIKHNGKIICSPKDLGINKKQINLLKKLYKENKIKDVLIKEGIPFIPSFFIAFIISLILLFYIPETAGNILFWLVY